MTYLTRSPNDRQLVGVVVVRSHFKQKKRNIFESEVTHLTHFSFLLPKRKNKQDIQVGME